MWYFSQAVVNTTYQIPIYAFIPSCVQHCLVCVSTTVCATLSSPVLHTVYISLNGKNSNSNAPLANIHYIPPYEFMIVWFDYSRSNSTFIMKESWSACLLYCKCYNLICCCVCVTFLCFLPLPHLLFLFSLKCFCIFYVAVMTHVV